MQKSYLQLALSGVLCIILACCGAEDRAHHTGARDDLIGAAFSVMRTTPEPLPSDVADHFASLLKRFEPSSPYDVQKERLGHHSVWIFLTKREMCLAQGDNGSVSCSSKSSARIHGVVLGTFRPPSKTVPRPHRFAVLGVMPDGVRAVTVRIGTKEQSRRIQVPVRRNLITVASEAPVVVGGLNR